ncbi:MAG: nucleotidyltransferase domain-containing protein [Candidatus Marsarchaeota archaeon]|nr:nucleotidyltransferase domain-containing protein [Candidatus Marsarchaeota archaeon]MCL5106451.1 nucleotidyltransferase domain-containing protein [Candidatus Marsarchaeota archaeon]
MAKALKVNKGTVSLAVHDLEVADIVKNKKVNLHNPLARQLKVIFIVSQIIHSGALKAVMKYAAAAGLYGSAAAGTDRSISDIDLWIKPKTDLSMLEVSMLAKKISKMLNRQVQIITINKVKLEKMKIESPNFYYSLVFGSLILFGERIE